MIITLTPVRMDAAQLVVARLDDCLNINGQVLDFSLVSDGADLPAADWGCDFLLEQVTRRGGILHLTLLLPHGADAGAETLFPAAIDDPENGPLPLPPYGRDTLA